MNMFSIRKWMFRPKKSDNSMLAQFFYADEELNLIAAELDSFDGRKDPERCTSLVNQLRTSQDKVLTIIEKIMNKVIPEQRANRDFRVKFPDDVLQESLAGQLWFGAECLAAGSLIMNREVESASMRPLAKSLTRHLDVLRSLLRDQCLRNQNDYTDNILESLAVFDRLFAEFELSYVSAMVPVKTMKEYDLMQDVVVLFCETLERALRIGLLKQDQLDDYDPALMFTIPRLAIVCGLLVFPEGPLNPDMDPMNMSEMFRPFQTLLYKIRELLWTLSRQELWLLEKSLCSTEEPVLGERSVEDQLNSINAGCKTNNRLSCLSSSHAEDTDPSKLSQSGSEYSQELTGSEHSQEGCDMSHSLSSMTIVASTGGGPDSDTDSGSDIEAGSSLPGKMADNSSSSSHSHHASNDSGLLSEPDICEPGQSTSNPVPSGSCTQPELTSVEARRLRHSQSWPEPTRSLQRSRQTLLTEAPIAEAEYTSSLEVLDDIRLEGRSNRRCTHSTGSQEFFFHLPRNTGLEDSTLVSLPGITSDNTEEDSQAEQVVLTNSSPVREDGQISFVTDALNQVFVTDPSFKGMSLSPWDQQAPPFNHIKFDGCEQPAVQNGSNPDVSEKIREPEVPSDSPEPNMANTVHTSQGVPSNCDISRDGHSLEETTVNDSPKVSSKNRASVDSINNTFEEKDNTETLEKELQRGKKRKSNRHKIVNCREGKCNGECLDVPKLNKMKYNETMNANCSHSHSPSVEYDWDRESYASSETSSYNSDSHDDEEIALAIQAAELAARREARGRFKSSADLIHRLFVCISGVADQLQTNYASDLRHILKAVFDCISLESLENEEEGEEEEADSTDSSGSEDSVDDGLPNEHHNTRSRALDEAEPPEWIPDGETPYCMACKVPFTFVRRRHHCRNCGKIFCGKCSSNCVPLPHYGHSKPVRVCNHCFVFQVTPFTVR